MSLIPPANQGTGLDFLALGALVHRLESQGSYPSAGRHSARSHVSGGEYNVAASLADCFALRAGIVSAMVDYPIGDLVAERVRAMDVTSIYKTFERDGVLGPNIATVYSDRGFGVRRPDVFYNRANEAAALLRPGDFDWDRIFTDGVRWFHSGESSHRCQTTPPADHRSNAGGALCWRCGLLRPQLPSQAVASPRWSGTRPGSTSTRIVENVDVLVGNEEDLQEGLGLVGPRVAGADRLDPDAFLGMIDQVIDAIHGSNRLRQRCARFGRPTGTSGRRSHGSTERPWYPILRTRRARPRRWWGWLRIGLLLRPA